MMTLVIFGFLAMVLVGAALGVILSRNPVYAALFLVLAFVTSAVLWLLLEAEFLAIVLVLVYVGAVMVLFLFVVMMLDVNVAVVREGFTRYAPIGAIVAGVMVFELVSVIWMRASGLPVARELVGLSLPDHSNTREIGIALYTNHVFEFELAAFILLLAIVAAIMLTLRHRPGLKVQDICGPGERAAGRPGPDRQGRRSGPMITLTHYLALSAALFAISVAGIFLNRKNVILLLMCIELMLLAVNFNFIALSRFMGGYDRPGLCLFYPDGRSRRVSHRARHSRGVVPDSAQHQCPGTQCAARLRRDQHLSRHRAGSTGRCLAVPDSEAA